MFQGMRELGGTTGDAGSHGRDTAVAGHELPVALVQMFSKKTQAWVNGYFLIK